ncbi:Hypothetical predicted protein [Prunus dulcis]|uniref:Uncharacterized protein n=1 Tax=Prunus dulcis TaxID=3755 RepID=A0A5E4EUF0_PRUDU|nr:Hypothetical predicted protein [Prunus dulcis]
MTERRGSSRCSMSTNDNKTRGLLGKDDIKDYVVDSRVVSPLKKVRAFPRRRA